ncbi:VanW family protein [Amycolatopsis magusensis]|uniref:Vancomycin resistance protein YoaR n=1 Tax=Amycolatopsis magusensis TaxID=882444 RepID=A0ABS4PKE4_9PSEU|nr:VanW family protein [Amycolatopsis magusensis]MBP2179894.1 vancomycin resistance protein YoaR [Amycolatopsis magusensis]
MREELDRPTATVPDHFWPEFDADLVEVEPPAPRQHDEGLADSLLDKPVVLERPRSESTRRRFAIGRLFVGIGAFLALFLVLYAADLYFSSGTVPRGVTVVGVHVGGMERGAAEALLRQELEPRLTKPVPVRAGDVTAELDPTTSGFDIDWAETVSKAGMQPLDPFTRIASFFTTREVGVVTSSDPDELKQALTTFAADQLNHAMTEGGIRFESIQGSDGGVTPIVVEPRQRQEMTDVRRAAELIKESWITGGQVELPVQVGLPKATSEGVRATLEQIVKPAVAQPTYLRGDGGEAVLKPDAIAAAMQFSPNDAGSLDVRIDQGSLQLLAQPQLEGTERQPKDAKIVFNDASPSVQPSEDGRKVAWAPTFAPLLDVVKRPDAHELQVTYEPVPPAVPTDAANAMGIKEVIGEYTSEGFSGDVARNVKTLAGKVAGAIVRPGDTFSLNGYAGPTTASQGYIKAPVHEDGTGAEVYGGGINQFTSTLYNAVYFAGLADAEHSSHSFHLARFPAGRDAKSLEDDGSAVDLRFTNDAPTGVAIQTLTSANSVTVKIWGTKRFRVEGETGPQSNVIAPPEERDTSRRCKPVRGIPGFTVTDTRIFYDPNTGAELAREPRVTTYAPRPHITCPNPPQQPAPPPTPRP